MERRTIGAGALEVGAVGLGCMPMSWAYTGSRQRGDASVRTVHAALDAAGAADGGRGGGMLLDTADMYGPFTNELLIGRVLKERRAEAFVSTKCGLLVGEQHIVANGRPGYVKRACDASLRRLQTDTIDLYQLHRADPEVPIEETWGAMAELVAAGKVRALGLCAVGARAQRRSAPGRPGPGLHDLTIRQLERVQQVFPVSAVQAELSVWSPEALDALLPWCVARGVGFLAAMPLGNGFLTGTLKPGMGFEPDDLRARHPRFTAEMMAANQPLVVGLRRVAERHGATPAQAALAWVLAQGRHVVPIPGAKRERWAVENAGAAAIRLTERDLAEIAALPPALGSWD
ncbi:MULTISPECIES: aldo/keto reductase [Streptomyces]|uniref:Oxidoreductase n=1 Tax=Streptomyces venezuelae TaxID=54571 RepID=A0A5P2BGW0_STRVZ|nr:aldo/keto reductase [Streptomyces venezuelae]MYY84290.1 aldo/keto reductase [Streptomyces sp. SID335]NDZ86560.1 aldo/keto reductase [Streptomyces sp. SID10115]NDZ99689.1 aldo/keto reductase [Streptomyces sp. SID10116]NEB48056.1 aldo/keto reductase [Streptomyces sp. SID339]QES29636.1 oxidoreductase [Streptomyces venezuelae]